MDKIIEEISNTGIIPVVVIEEAENAEKLGEALCSAGLMSAEVTFRTEAAEKAIQIMTSKFPEMLIGAGTILTIEQAKYAINAGAKFIVSPGLNEEIVQYCINNNITVIPGVLTPTEVDKAIRLGLTAVKFFPAEISGGVKMIKAISEPYPDIKFFASGGINHNNIKDYLDFNKILACSGSWMVDKNLISMKKFRDITNLANQAVITMLDIKVTEFISSESEKRIDVSILSKLEEELKFYKKIDDLSMKKYNNYYNNSLYLDKKDMIILSTRDITRAIYYLSKFNVEFNMKTAEYDSNKKIIGISLKKKIQNHEIRLLQIL